MVRNPRIQTSNPISMRDNYIQRWELNTNPIGDRQEGGMCITSKPNNVHL